MHTQSIRSSSPKSRIDPSLTALICAAMVTAAFAGPGLIYDGHACQNNNGCQSGQTKYTGVGAGSGSCTVYKCCNQGLKGWFGYDDVNVNQLLDSICCFNSQTADWNSQTPVGLSCYTPTNPCNPYDLGCDPGDL